MGEQLSSYLLQISTPGIILTQLLPLAEVCVSTAVNVGVNELIPLMDEPLLESPKESGVVTFTLGKETVTMLANACCTNGILKISPVDAGVGSGKIVKVAGTKLPIV